MIIFNSLTFQQIRIDENKATQEQVELIRKISILTKRINSLVAKQFLAVYELEAFSKMRMKDLIGKLTID